MASRIKNIFKKEENKKSGDVERRKHEFIAAIDFGTTFTGYAFCVKEETDICMSMFYSKALSSEKAPTSVLLDKNKNFVAFGYLAEEEYESICDSGTSEDYYFFERFKMALFETKKLKRDTKIKEDGGKELEAMHVFSEVIKHLTESVYDQCHSRITGFSTDDVLWVLTVPAIWSEAAKQFMREAANKAGIKDPNLKLILEPEAASLYCQGKNSCKVVKVDGSVKFEPLPVGQRYIVADLGGGTADIAVHEILEDHNLREISRSDGDAYGGIQIDRAFMQFLDDVYGREVMSNVLNDLPLRFDLRNTFEVKKRSFQFTGDKWVPFSLMGFVPALEKANADKSEIVKLAIMKFENKIKFTNEYKFSIHPDIMKGFFHSALDGIIKFIQKLRHDNDLGIINTVMLVGGLSESKYIQHVIQKEIEGIRIITPTESRLAVIKGAIIFGRNPKVITQRIARFSYGFSVARDFHSNVDPENLKVLRNGQQLCTEVFDKLITKGESLEIGGIRKSFVSKEVDRDDFLSLLLSSALPVVSEVYKSEDKDPRYTDSAHGCECMGRILIMPPSGGWPMLSIIAHGFLVGESELQAFAMDIQSGRLFAARLDCL